MIIVYIIGGILLWVLFASFLAITMAFIDVFRYCEKQAFKRRYRGKMGKMGKMGKVK